MAEVNLFENYAAKDFSVLFQKDVDLDTKIDIRYIKSGEEEIKYMEIKGLFIENSEKTCVEGMERYIIDKDKCEIY